MPAAAGEIRVRVILTPRAEDALRKYGARYLLLRLIYTRGPCPDDWCPLVPTVVVEPSGKEPGEGYVRLGEEGRVLAADRVARSMKVKDGGITIDFARGKFVVKGASFDL